MPDRADLISRAAALDTIDHERKILIEQNRFGAEHVVVHHARRIIEELPTIDAIPVGWLKYMQQESLSENDRTMVGAIEAIFIEWHIYVNRLCELSRQNEQEAQDG